MWRSLSSTSWGRPNTDVASRKVDIGKRLNQRKKSRIYHASPGGQLNFEIPCAVIEGEMAIKALEDNPLFSRF
jgi:hypothetical protein